MRRSAWKLWSPEDTSIAYGENPSYAMLDAPTGRWKREAVCSRYCAGACAWAGIDSVPVPAWHHDLVVRPFIPRADAATPVPRPEGRRR